METRVAQALSALAAETPPRVWSLIVTAFGDLAQGEGETLSGAALAALTGAVGVRPDATRVALHRLKRDGWIESERSGRTSLYRLSVSGRDRSAAVTPRIYARDGVVASGWQVIAVGETEALVGIGPDAVPLAPGVALVPGGATAPGDAFVLEGEAAGFPDWLRARVCDAALVAASARLSRALAGAAAALGETPVENALDRAALRVMIVHDWRRLVLKAPALPDAVFPPGWEGAACRRSVAALLDRLPRPDTAAIEEAAQKSV